MSESRKEMKNVYVVLNGKKSGDENLREAVSHLRKEGHNVEVRVTYESGDSERFVAEALQNNSDVIVAAGGDGSVNELAAALIKLKAPKETCMAVIPMGTANDFATAAGIPEDPWEALELAVTDTAYPIDVGMVNNQVFMNVATGGFGTEITTQTDEGLKNKLGGAAYFLTGMVEYIYSRQSNFVKRDLTSERIFCACYYGIPAKFTSSSGPNEIVSGRSRNFPFEGQNLEGLPTTSAGKKD